MPEEQERRSSKRRVQGSARTGDLGGGADTASSGTSSEPIDPKEPVDFRAAAQRLSARAAQIAQLKADVENGAYRADAEETARAMDRRSDS